MSKLTNLDEYNPENDWRNVVVFCYMITEKNLEVHYYVSLAFITQCFFRFPKSARLNSAQYISYVDVPNKIKLQETAHKHAADIVSEELKKDLQEHHS